MTDTRLARWSRRWRGPGRGALALEVGRLINLELGNRAAGLLLKCGRTSADNVSMSNCNHSATVRLNGDLWRCVQCGAHLAENVTEVAAP